jgi:hypothetical protein
MQTLEKLLGKFEQPLGEKEVASRLMQQPVRDGSTGLLEAARKVREAAWATGISVTPPTPDCERRDADGN